MTDSKLVLIVEDDRVIRVLSAELLLEAGMETLEAADGEEAFELLEHRAAEIAAIVTDIQMPGACDGVELACAVAAQWPWISILVTSGKFGERPPGLPEDALYLGKPWKPEAVLGFARRALRTALH